METLNIARGLKDKSYFDSLGEADQTKVMAANPVGIVNVSDSDLESVCGGLEGGTNFLATSTDCLVDDDTAFSDLVRCNC